jgi:hypothetical protein
LEREKSRDSFICDESERGTEREPSAETKNLTERKSGSEISWESENENRGETESLFDPEKSTDLPARLDIKHLADRP